MSIPQHLRPLQHLLVEPRRSVRSCLLLVVALEALTLPAPGMGEMERPVELALGSELAPDRAVEAVREEMEEDMAAGAAAQQEPRLLLMEKAETAARMAVEEAVVSQRLPRLLADLVGHMAAPEGKVVLPAVPRATIDEGRTEPLLWQRRIVFIRFLSLKTCMEKPALAEI